MNDENATLTGGEYTPPYEYLKFSGSNDAQRPTEPAEPSPMDYFKGAKILVYCTGGAILVIFILIFISEWFGKACIYDKLLSMVKDFLYPFLTLMVGYMFGKGFSNDENK